MSVYDAGKISRMAVRKCNSGIEFGINSFTEYSVSDILLMQPSNINSEIEVMGGRHTYRVFYPHFIFRVLLVLGYRPSNNSKAEERLSLLRRVNVS